MEYYEPHTDFDYDAIYRREEGEEEVDYLKESMVLNALLEFIAPPRFRKNATLCRVYAVIFVCRRNWFNNPSITQVEVAEMLGVSKSVFNAHVREFNEKFNFIVNGQRGDEARAKFSEICASRADELADARRNASKRKKKDND